MSEAVATSSDSEKKLRSLFGPAENGVFTGVPQTSRERSMRVKYWRKPDFGPDAGWIQLGPDVQTDAPKYAQFTQTKKWRELPDSFGKEIHGTADSMMTGRKRPGQEHRWLQPFVERGGLTYIIRQGDTFGTPGEYLIPASQLVALNLHRDPSIRAQRPDLADAVDIECPYACTDDTGRRKFSGLNLSEAQAKVDNHIVAVHKDAVASRAVGDTIANAMKAQGTVDTGQITAIVAAVMAALNPVEKGAIAAVAPEEFRGPAQPEPTFEAFSAVPDETWTRAKMFAWMKEQGMAFPEKFQSYKQAELLSYIRENSEGGLEDAGESSEG